MDVKIISETEPTNVYTGKLWIKPSNAMMFLRLGSQWIFIGQTEGAISLKNVTVLINGIDVTNMILKNSLSIMDVITREVDECTFALVDSDGTHKPEVGQEVNIFYYNGSNYVLRFAGKIEEVPQVQIKHGVYSYELTCVDYTQELNRRLVVETYTGQTAGDIIRDIVSNYALGLGTAYVQDGPSINSIAFNYKYPMECIEELAALTGYDWYVDYERQVHFFESATTSAPYELNESSTSGEYRDLQILIHKSELKNAMTVRGGYEFSDLYTQEEVADGTQESFTLRYAPYAPISVYVDTGGGYSLKTLGIDNIDESGRDFVYNQHEKVIKNLDYGVLSAGHKIKITYKYKKPILAYQEDDESIQLMAEYEGGDGKYEAPLIVDDSIETKAQARARGIAELNQYSNPLVEGTFTTTQYGYRSGQILTINLPSRGYTNRQYIIQEVTATSLGMGNFSYEVTFASLLKGLTDYLIQLHKDSRIKFERTDENLDRLKIMAGEGIQLTHSSVDGLIKNMTTNPYRWSNDAGTTTDKGRWNLAQWG